MDPLFDQITDYLDDFRRMRRLVVRRRPLATREETSYLAWELLEARRALTRRAPQV